MTEEKENNMEKENNSGIKGVIMRVIKDDEFKQKLIDNPDEALENYELTATQKILLKSLKKEDLENLTPENVEEFFSAESAVYSPDAEADPDEFETFDDEGETLL